MFDCSSLFCLARHRPRFCWLLLCVFRILLDVSLGGQYKYSSLATRSPAARTPTLVVGYSIGWMSVWRLAAGFDYLN